MKKVLLAFATVIVIVIALVLAKGDNNAPSSNEVERETVQDSLILTLFEPIDVASKYDLILTSQIEEVRKTVNNVEFRLTSTPTPPVAGKETILTYNLSIDGKPATDMQTHLGVYGSSAAVRKGTLEVVTIEILRKATPHGTLQFRTVFPESGDYKIFTQFKRGGEIITTDFDISVI
ncbi:MAG TPA: hypothetical protein VJJ48_02590 [Candidatus Paceibacterota bacterium]